MANTNYVQMQVLNLYAAGVVPGDTTATFQSMKSIDGVNLTMADFGAKGFITHQPGAGTSEEQISFTGLAQNSDGTATISGVKSVLFASPYTESSGYAKNHSGGTTAVVAVTSGFLNMFANKTNTETVTNVWTFNSSTGRPGLSSDVDTAVATDFVSFGQLSRQAIAGAANASTTVKGLVELATAAEFIAGTTTGGTGALLVPTPDLFSVAGGVSKGIISKTNGLLDDSLLALTTAGDMVYSDGTDLVRLAKGTTGLFLEAGASAPQWGGANLAEANTFFGATAITGAQATTLSAGQTSDATDLHHHANLIASVTNLTQAASTTETTVLTATLPAGILSTKHGVRIRITCAHVADQNGDDLNIRFKLGGTTVYTLTPSAGSIATQDSTQNFEVIIINTSTTAQKYAATGVTYQGTTPALVMAAGTAAVDTTGAVAVAVTSQTPDDNSNAVIIYACTFEYLYAV